MAVKKRVAMISEHASPIALLGGEDAGGQNVYVSEVSRHLSTLGYEVDVFTRRDQASAPEVKYWLPGVRVVYLNAGPAEFLKKDEMWPHMPEFRDSLLRFAGREGRGYDLIHANFWMSGWVGCEVKFKVAPLLVEIFHALGKVKRLHQGEADTSPDERWCVEQRIIATADRIIAQCPSEVEELKSLYGADASHVRVVPSAVNTEIFQPVPMTEARALVGISPDEAVAVYVGRMLPRKGIDNLLRAAALIRERSAPSIRLLLVGGETEAPDPLSTPEIGRLTSLAQELRIMDRVTFTGKRQQRMLKYYYSGGDVSVTTPWYEPYGLTPLEAMSCGRPVIGSAVGGITFTVAEGETGYLVPPNSPSELAARLELLLTNRELRDKMGGAALRRVEELFTWQQVGERTAAVYEEILARHLEVG